jgi:hypothetical protein
MKKRNPSGFHDTIWALEEVAVAPDLRPLSLAGNEHISAFLMTENGVPWK